MVEHFDANSPGPSDDLSSLMARLQQDVATTRIDALLHELRDVVSEQAEQEAEESLDPAIIARLEAVTGAEGAPLAFASLHRRVEQGITSWEQFWADPRREADGLRILTAVLALTTSQSRAAAEETPFEQYDGVRGEAPRRPGDAQRLGNRKPL